MSAYEVISLPAGGGTLGIAPMPGRKGAYQADFARLLAWDPTLVLTMTTAIELTHAGASGMGDDLAAMGIGWRHLPIPDFGAPPPETAALWPEASATARAALRGGGRVVAHCWGGCGRSGMALNRLMIEMGEAPEAALARLRAVRPCAVETGEQEDWARDV